jgi:hypothetical protein
MVQLTDQVPERAGTYSKHRQGNMYIYFSNEDRQGFRTLETEGWMGW